MTPLDISVILLLDFGIRFELSDKGDIAMSDFCVTEDGRVFDISPMREAKGLCSYGLKPASHSEFVYREGSV